MGYSIFLDGHKLPCTSEQVTVKDGAKSKEYDIIGVGRVQQPEARDLRTVEFETELPGQVYGYVDASAWEEPKVWIWRLRGLLDNGTPFRFVAVGEVDKLTLQVTLEGLTVKETGGEDGDCAVSIKVKECPDFGAVITAVEKLPRPGRMLAAHTTVPIGEGETALDVQKRYGKGGVVTGKNLGAKNPAMAEGGDLYHFFDNNRAKARPGVTYLSNGDVMFPVEDVTSTIPAGVGVEVGQEIGEKLNDLAAKVNRGIQDLFNNDFYKNVPK